MLHFDLLRSPRHGRDPVTAIQRFVHNVRANFSACAVDDDVERLFGACGTCC
jgi:hypothetical protein